MFKYGRRGDMPYRVGDFVGESLSVSLWHLAFQYLIGLCIWRARFPEHKYVFSHYVSNSSWDTDAGGTLPPLNSAGDFMPYYILMEFPGRPDAWR